MHIKNDKSRNSAGRQSVSWHKNFYINLNDRVCSLHRHMFLFLSGKLYNVTLSYLWIWKITTARIIKSFYFHSLKKKLTHSLSSVSGLIWSLGADASCTWMNGLSTEWIKSFSIIKNFTFVWPVEIRDALFVCYIKYRFAFYILWD